MIFQSPKLNHEDAAVLELIAEQKERLRTYTAHNPRRWSGSLRRAMFARAIQGSNSIEGYNVTLDEAVAAIENEQSLDERTETWYAVRGYRDAMTYIMQAAKDPHFEFSAQFLKSLHFMMLQYDMNKNPGQWRPGSVFVINSKTDARVYEAPDIEFVNDLIEELVFYLKAKSNEPGIVRAAMAHLNFTMIHPFSDGNGRIARALQTLVIAGDGILNPVFSSIEEWLGDNTQEYYDILALVGQGKWNPTNNALPWVRFCLKAHYQQAGKLIRRSEEAEALYNEIVKLVQLYSLHERTWMPLFDAALGMKVTNPRYRKDVDISEFTAGRDLKKLCEVELLVPQGERKMRTYSAGKLLADLRKGLRISRVFDDPYELVQRRAKKAQAAKESPRLPGL
jgi:Fic family protein